MNILFIIIPISLLVVAGIIWIFVWSVKSGQFDDMEGPAHRILMDDEVQSDEAGSDKGRNDETGPQS